MKIGLLGFGVVGSGVYDIIANGTALELRNIEVKRIISLVVTPGFEHLITKNIDDIVNDDEIELVVEAMGGLHPAYEFVMACINAGKHVVSSNKHLVSNYFTQLNEAAEKNNVQFRYTPSAGGGIPWLSTLKRARRSDEIEQIWGIVNGTTNYILDSMVKDDTDFSVALKEAQRLGYAEADPSADIDGLDTQRKCIISANLAFDVVIDEKDVPAFGIRNITHSDVSYFEKNGWVCKLFANAGRNQDDSVYAYVVPVLLDKFEIEAGVASNYNCITYVGKYVGRSSYIGQGAGKLPTGNSVVQDILDTIFDDASLKREYKKSAVNNAMVAHRYYIKTDSATPELSEIIEKDEGDGRYITKPVSIECIQKTAEGLFEKCPQTFIAEIK
ncbi:MAG: homoserine dehydrogenase [Clostridia bacterium]|nr:homoserine dehydrogenase [Clostridia bacterium]